MRLQTVADHNLTWSESSPQRRTERWGNAESRFNSSAPSLRVLRLCGESGFEPHSIAIRCQHLVLISRPVIALALFILLGGCQASSNNQPGVAGAPPGVVATVNDRPIPTRLYEMYLKNGQEALAIDASTDEGKRKLELLREGIVSELIDRILIAQEAERRGLSISPEEMRQAEQRTAAQFGGEKQYDEYLTGHRLSREEYRDVIRWELYGGKLRAELSKEISLTDDDVKRYYDEHKGDQALQLPERVTASHILIAARPNLIRAQLEREQHLTGDALEKGVREEMERRRARAAELRRKAAAGADFSQLARESSEDPSSREQGGSLGAFTRDSHPRAFDDAAFALKPGAVSQVVQTDFGYHIIKVSAHDQARPKTLEEATPEIRQRLMSERLAVHLKEWLAQARRSASIRINEAFRFGSLRQEFPAM
jgi:parvulin-like peptidyl-prolyl isomerase